MRRSISYCEPSTALAGEVKNWNFIYVPATDLPKDTRVKFDLLSEGRDIDWELPITDLKAEENVVFCQLPDGKKIEGKEVELPDRLTPQFEFILPKEIAAGEHLTIVLGCPKEKKKSKAPKGSQAQLYSQRRRAFHLFINTKGKQLYDDPEVMTMDIKGNELSFIRVLTPSFATRNKRFDVIARFEDQYGNLTANTPEGTLIELSHEQLRENLNWKLFIPETGFINLPNLYFNEPGVYTIKLHNRSTGETFCSPPIKCFEERETQLFWGCLHGESEKIDSTENIESCLRHFRDERALNFVAVSPFENAEEMPNEMWKRVSQNLIEFNEPDRFSTITGFQWQGKEGTEGIRHFIFTKDSRPIFRKKDPKYNSLKKIYKMVAPKECISIPSFTMGSGFQFDFKEFDPRFERVVEIYNAWGSSECTKEEGNPLPIGPDVKETAEGSIQKALLNNCRFGFVAGGMDDRGIYSDFFESEQVQYTPGFTAVIAKEHNRASILEALHDRSCYATTGARIVMGLSLANACMGSELNTKDKPGLTINRHLAGYIAGSAPIKKLEIIRNAEVIHTLSSEEYWLDFEYDDMEPLEKITTCPNSKQPPFAFYYMRVTQEDGHIGWTSPIWVDDLRKEKEASKTP